MKSMTVPGFHVGRTAAGLVLVSSLSIPALAEAQPRERLRDRARTFLVLRLTEALDLSDEEALGVSRVFRESEAHRKELETERRGIEREIRGVLRSGNPDPKTLAPLVERATKIDQEMALVPNESFRKLRELLSVEQQAKLVLARPKIHEEIQGAMRRRLEERRERKPPADAPASGRQP